MTKYVKRNIYLFLNAYSFIKKQNVKTTDHGKCSYKNPKVMGNTSNPCTNFILWIMSCQIKKKKTNYVLRKEQRKEKHINVLPGIVWSPLNMPNVKIKNNKDKIIQINVNFLKEFWQKNLLMELHSLVCIEVKTKSYTYVGFT